MALSRWAERARKLKTELYALYLAARHPGTPWYAKLVVAVFVAYAITPVDFGAATPRRHAEMELAGALLIHV